MKIGVTGTRSGMTDLQRKSVTDLLYSYGSIPNMELHHGDCFGVDVEVAEIADEVNFKIICHPPIKNDLRAYHKSNEVREAFSYFKRNRNIVDDTDILYVVPYQQEWTSHGGTWYTHDYANKHNKDIVIIYPDGFIWEKVRSKLF